MFNLQPWISHSVGTTESLCYLFLSHECVFFLSTDTCQLQYPSVLLSCSLTVHRYISSILYIFADGIRDYWSPLLTVPVVPFLGSPWLFQSIITSGFIIAVWILCDLIYFCMWWSGQDILSWDIVSKVLLTVWLFDSYLTLLYLWTGFHNLKTSII